MLNVPNRYPDQVVLLITLNVKRSTHNAQRETGRWDETVDIEPGTLFRI